MNCSITVLRKVTLVAVALACTLVVVQGGGACAVTLPYFQDFSASTTDFAFTTPAEWSVGGGALNLVQEGGNSRLSAAAVQVADSLAGVPLTVSATVQATQLLSNSDFGLVVYSDSPSFAISGTNHYIVDFKPNGNFRIVEVRDGVAADLSIYAPSSNWFSFSPTDTYTLNFTSRPVATGTELTLSVFDPTPGQWHTVSAIDTTPFVGSYFGLRARTSGQTDPITGWYDDFEISRMTNKIMHGDFDRLPSGTKPDNGSPIGPWQIHESGSNFRESSAGEITIANKPNPAGGTFAHDHALRINVTGSTTAVFAEQILPEAWSDTNHKLVMTHEHITNADGDTYKNNGNWTFVNGSHSATGPYVGLHDRLADGGGHKIRYWGAGTENALATYTPGETYLFRTSVDMQTKRFDLFVRGGEYERWTQIGKQLAFSGSGVSQVDRLHFGEYWGRTADVYIDNVSVVNSADLPQDHIVRRNSFNYYAPNVNLVDQNDGWRMGEGAATPASAQAVPDTFTGRGNMARLVAGTTGPFQRSAYQDLDLVIDSGKARFDVDAMWVGGVSNSWGYFGIGDSDMTMTLASSYAGLRSSAALFGFHGDGGQLRFMASDGDYLAGSGSRLETPASADTWYTFVAEVELTGPDRNTWDLRVFERDTETLVWEQTGMDFVTNHTDILRFGAYVYDAGGNGTLYFDNFGVNIPEPGAAVLLAFGLAALLLSRMGRGRLVHPGTPVARMILVFAFVLVMAGPALASPILYVNDFEPPLYTAGDLVGQDGWGGVYSSGGTANNPTQIIAADSLLPPSVAAGRGQVLYNYRPFGSQIHRVYRDVTPAPIDQGTVVLSYDGLRTGTADNTAWFFVNNEAGEANYLAYWGLANPGAAGGFVTYNPNGNVYSYFGNISMDEWYGVEVHLRLSGAGQNTYDLVARNAAGAIVGSKLDMPFATTGVPLGKFHVRTFDDGSGTLVDNLKLARPVDKVRHGSFDAYQTGNLLGQAGWTQGGATGTPSVMVAADAQGQGKHARFTPTGTNGWVGTYQDLLETDFVVPDPTTIIYTVEGAWTGDPTYADTWGWFSIGNESLTLGTPGDASTFMNSAANFGFREHATSETGFFVVDGSGNTTFDTFRYSSAQFETDTWYRFESLIYPMSNEWDLLVYERDTDELVWDSFTDLGSHLGFGTDDVDLTRIGVYVRDTTGTFLVDNLSVTGIPEPGAAVLLALGCASLWMLPRRRTRRPGGKRVVNQAIVAICLALLVPLAADAALVNSVILWETDFEAPDYSIDYLVPQQGWTESWDSGTHANRGEVVASSGYGQVLYNYRASSSQSPNHNYHGLAAVGDSGVVTLSFDARRVDTPNSTAWFNIMDSSLNHVTAIGMEVPSSTAGFRVQRDATTYVGFGNLAWDTWYRMEFELRLTGPDAGTYDFVARRPNGALAAELRNEPFFTPGASPDQFRIRTFGIGSGVQVDNIRYAEGRVINKIMHGDFDRLAVGTLPNNGAPVGGWQVSTSTGYTEKNSTQLTIAQKPGAAPGDHAMRVNVVTPLPSNATYAEQILAAPYEKGHHKFIMEHEQVTVAGMCGADVLISNGATRSIAASFGLRNEAAGGAYFIRVWPGTSGQDIAPWTPGMTYQFRSSVDLMTETFDLYVRSPDDTRYARWTQIGKEVSFPAGSGPFTQLDRVVFGQYYRSADSFVDNVVAVNSANLPLGVHYTNSFQDYTVGNLVGQHGWVAGVVPGSAQVLDDPLAGSRVGRVNAHSSTHTYLYHDLDVIAEHGEVAFRVDAMRTQTSGWGYFVLGDSDMGKSAGSEFNPSAATFGFYNGRFIVRPGDGVGGWNPSTVQSGVSFAADTWYTFQATMQFTGEDRNTWELQVLDRDTQTLLWSYADAGFRTDFTDLTRLGMFVSGGAGALQFDNFWLANVPEPGTVALLVFGLPLLLMRRRRG